MTLLTSGCGSPAPSEQQAETKTDPEGEFEWGMRRLDRALRVFKPSGVNGMSVTRELNHKLFPPGDQNPNYTAHVTVSSKTLFLHAKRIRKANENPSANQQEKSEIEDPYAEKLTVPDLVDIPGTGSQAPVAAPTRIEPRTIESETLFELVYSEGRWKLSNQPELEHEQLWFEYAFGE